MQLTATGADGLVPKAPRPNGLQVRNSDPLLASNRESEFSNQPEPLHPVTIAGARNGSFCGKVIVGSAQPIKDLKVTPSDLKCATGTIPASAVLIRYGTPWGSDMDKVAKPAGLDILLESPLKEFPVRKNGALVAVWMKVKVPARSPAGDYQGKVTIEAQGSKPLEVPVTVKVADWSLPDAQDYRTWVDMIQSPDSLALEYDVPPWSDKHWELIGRSMDYLNEVGSRIVYLPLICHTNLGNEQSMVRWIRKGETGYEYDFSIMEKYLDIVEKHMGEPKIVVLQAWEIYLRGDDGKNLPAADSGWHEYVRRMREARMALNGKGPAVTVVDPVTGKLETEYLPPYKDPAAKGLWQPVFAELRKRLARRGMAEAMMLGLASDAWPSKEEVVLLHELSGGLPWVSQSHGGSNTGILGFPYSGDGMYGVAKVGYATNVWDLKFVLDPSKGRSYGWKLPYLVAQHDRFGYINTAQLSTLRSEPEFNITGYQRGVGRIGADLWFVIRNKRGQRVGMVPGRYPQSNWRNLDLGACILAPGPDRPVASARYENLREGVQECEARIFIEQALIDETLKAKLGDDLAKRCQEALDERLRYMWKGTSTLQLMGRQHDYATGSSTTGLWRYAAGVSGHYWFLGSAWQKRNEKLFTLAGEVQKAIRQK